MHESDTNNQRGNGSASSRTTPDVRLYLGGRSTKYRQAEKERDVIAWVYEHGASSADLIRQVARQEARGYANKLVRRGLLTATLTEGGGFVRGVPKAFYTLTELGLAEAERHVAVPMKYVELEPSKVPQRLLRHNFIAQQVTWDMRRFNICTKFLSDRRLSLRMAGKTKRPDAVWFMFDESKVGVEVELTSKWDRDLDAFVAGIIDLMCEEDQSIKLDEYRIFSDSPQLLENYKKAMAPGMPLRRWEKSPLGKWVVSRIEQVPDWLAQRAHFSRLDVWAKDHGRCGA